MTTRQLDIPDVDSDVSNRPRRDLTLRSPRGWTAILFFTGLGALHLSIAIPAFYHGRMEGFLSAGFGVVFVTTAIVLWVINSEIVIEAQARRIRLRTGCCRLWIERSIPFRNVHGVRLTVHPRSPRGSRIEILCDNEDVECPPTDIPRQQALCLALTLNARLIKVYGDEGDPDAAVSRVDVVAPE